MLIPKGVCDKIESIIRSFIWSGDGEARKCHLVNWEVITRAKRTSGLGIRRMNCMKKAFLTKLGWRLIKEKERLWVDVLRSKYCEGNRALEDIKDKRGSSNAWKGINACVSTLKISCKSWVRNDKNTKFWLDNWLMDAPLRHYACRDVGLSETYAMVNEFWIPGVGWDWDYLRDVLPSDILDRLADVTVSEEEDENNDMYWWLEDSRNFSVAPAYYNITGSANEKEEGIWDLIWRTKVPNRVRAFMWKATHERIMCNQVRYRRGFTTYGNCLFCRDIPEDTEYVLRGCPKAREVWEAIAPKELWN